MSIVTLQLAKDQLGIKSNASDAELQLYVEGITSVVENYKRKIIEKREVTERLTLCGRPRFRLWKVPVVDLVSLVAIDGSVTWDVANLDVDTDTGLVDVLRGPAPTGRALATTNAGYDPVPENYVRGALVIIQHVWETQRGTAGTRGGVVGPEEMRRSSVAFTFPNKAREWLGAPRPVVG